MKKPLIIALATVLELTLAPQAIAASGTQPHYYATALNAFIAGADESTALLRDIDGDGTQEVVAVKNAYSGYSTYVAVKIFDIENGQNLSAGHNFSYVEGAYVYFSGGKIVCFDGQSGENKQDIITYSGGGIAVDKLSYAYDMDGDTFRYASLNGTRITEKRLNQVLAECKETETIYSVFGNKGSGDTAKILAMTVNVGVTARPTAEKVLVNGRHVVFDAYNINDNNYFKLRDLAFALSGTGSQFEVTWDSANNAILLTSGLKYTPVSGEMESKGTENKAAVPTSSSIFLDGSALALTAYNIGNNNYFKLRDVAAAIGFGVDWDGASQTITIETYSVQSIGFYNPAYDYSANPKYKFVYLCIGYVNPDLNNAFAQWATLANVEYGGYLSTESNEELLAQLPLIKAQGYDGVLLDPDVTQYEQIAKICDEIGLQWMGCMSQAVSYDKNYVPRGLLHPYVGFSQFESGRLLGAKLIEYAKSNWPNVPLDEIGFIGVGMSVASSLHQRVEGSRAAWMSAGGSSANFFVADVGYALNIVGGQAAVESVIEQNPRFEYWLIVSVVEDLAEGASYAIENAFGYGDNACIGSFGGTVLHMQWDSGMESAWRYALDIPAPLYAEPIFFALYAFVNGDATPETIWPSWIDHNPASVPYYGETYAQLMLPVYIYEQSNYKQLLTWVNLYTRYETYYYNEPGVTIGSYSARATVPASYRG
jgi:ABC-type sugar transport system substrate-binding protein